MLCDGIQLPTVNALVGLQFKTRNLPLKLCSSSTPGDYPHRIFHLHNNLTGLLVPRLHVIAIAVVEINYIYFGDVIFRKKT